MNKPNIQKKGGNFAIAFSILVIGGIFLGNLFEAIPWHIWQQGAGILVGAIFILDILCKCFCNKKVIYTISQILIFLLTLALILHTFLIITEPNYLSMKNQNLTAEQLFNDFSELNIDAYSDIQTKELNVNIEEYTYKITDSLNDSYYFRMHPQQKVGTDAFLSHRQIDSILKIDFSSTKPQLRYLEKLLNQDPTFVFGMPEIPTNVDITLNNGGILNLNLERQKTQNFTATLQNSQLNLKFSETSLPTSKLSITLRGGELDLNLPKELGFKVKYITQDIAELTIGGQRVRQRGEYSIASGGQEWPCLIEITVDSGVAKVNLY